METRKAALLAAFPAAILVLIYAHILNVPVSVDCDKYSNSLQTHSSPSTYVHHVYSSKEAGRLNGDTLRCTRNKWLPSFWLGTNTVAGDMLFGTSVTQHFIWHHQNPLECSNKKFLVYASDEPFKNYGHGIGSTLHIATWALAKAMDTDRILILAPTPDGVWSQGKFCDGYDNLHDCYFEPTSTCSYNDAVGEVSFDDIAYIDDDVEQHHLRVVRCDIGFAMADAALVPTRLKALLHASPIAVEKLYFYFRAQAVAYIVRPTGRTLAEIERRKQLQGWVGVPDGAISVHVRHGDKGIEMPLAPDNEYALKAEQLIAEYPDLRRVIFLSTEDAKSVEFFKQYSNWTVLSLDVPRPDHDSVVGVTAYAQQIGADEEMLNSLVNLDLALECSAWVGTIASNWDRLIEELRSTVRCKAQMPYIDAHTGWEINNYFW